MVKQIIMVQHITEYYSTIKRNKLLKHKSAWWISRTSCYMQKKKPISNDHTLCDAINITVSKLQIYGNKKQD